MINNKKTHWSMANVAVIGTIIIAILAIQASAASQITWINPKNSGDILDTYPYNVKSYVNSTGTITNCWIRVGSSTGLYC